MTFLGSTAKYSINVCVWVNTRGACIGVVGDAYAILANALGNIGPGFTRGDMVVA